METIRNHSLTHFLVLTSSERNVAAGLLKFHHITPSNATRSYRIHATFNTRPLFLSLSHTHTHIHILFFWLTFSLCSRGVSIFIEHEATRRHSVIFLASVWSLPIRLICWSGYLCLPLVTCFISLLSPALLAQPTTTKPELHCVLCQQCTTYFIPSLVNQLIVEHSHCRIHEILQAL